MQTQDTITSAQNPKIKALLQLQQKSACRREQGLFVVEGRRELMHCLSKGYQADTMFVCNEIMTAEEEYDKLLKALPSCKPYMCRPMSTSALPTVAELKA